MSRRRLERMRLLGDEPLYCQAEPAEVIYAGSDDEAYETPTARRWAYEVAAVNFLNGHTRPLMSARLRGPFDKSSGWTNPWGSKKLKDSSKQPLSAVPQPPPKTKKAAPKKINKASSTCPLPSPVSLDNKITEPHRYLDEDDLARVEDWRSSVDHGKPQADSFWAPSAQPTSGRKRRAETGDWLKRPQNKRRRALEATATDEQDRVSLVTHNNPSSPIRPIHNKQECDDVQMEEDELQADIEKQALGTNNIITPTKKSPTRRGLHQSPQRSLEPIESEDELSRPSESLKRPHIWRAASARSQISRPGQAFSPRSSPSRRFLRANTTTPATNKSSKTTNKNDIAYEFETQQDKGFLFRARRRRNAGDPPLQQSKAPQAEQASSRPRSIPDDMSDFTSPGRSEMVPRVGARVLVPDSPCNGHAVVLVAQGSTPASPASCIIPSSQPMLKSSTLLVKKAQLRSTKDQAKSDINPEVEMAQNPSPPKLVEEARSNLASSDSSTVQPCATSNNTMEVIAQESAYPRGDSVVSSQVQLEVEEQILVESIEVEMAEISNGGQDGSPAQCQPNPGLGIAASAPTEGEPTRLSAQASTPPPAETSAIAESQQTPWQANVVPRASDEDSPALLHAHPEAAPTQCSDPIAFSQGRGLIPTVSQQTPWYEEAFCSPLPQLQPSAENPILMANTQSPWSRSFEQMHSIAQRALYAATSTVSFSHVSQQSLNDPLPEEMPEESASIASGETPSLHTAPSTPGKDGPDPVFEDASSPHDDQSSTPKEDSFKDGFMLKPFSAFRSPSPERERLKPRKARTSRGPISTQSILVITPHNLRDTTSRSKKQVTWVLPQATSEGRDDERAGRTMGAPTQARALSPPPDQALADLPTGDKDPFKNHFSAVQMKAKGHRHRILPSASQQVWRTPSPMATAEAFIAADELVKDKSSAEADVQEAELRSGPVEEQTTLVAVSEDDIEDFDDVDEVLRNLGDFLDMVDVEADVDKAKADILEEQAKKGAPLATPLATDVWDQL